GGPEPLVGPQTRQLGARAGGKRPEDRERPRGIGHRLVVEDHEMTHQRTRWIENGNAQVALGAELDQILVGGKEPLDVAAVMGDVALEDPKAGRSRDVILEVLPEAAAVPARARADPSLGPVHALRDERVADAQRRSEAPDRRIEEVAPGHRGGALDDRAKRLLDLAPPRGFVTN